MSPKREALLATVTNPLVKAMLFVIDNIVRYYADPNKAAEFLMYEYFYATEQDHYRKPGDFLVEGEHFVLSVFFAAERIAENNEIVPTDVETEYRKLIEEAALIESKMYDDDGELHEDWERWYDDYREANSRK